MLTSYHVHSNYSDGDSSIAEIVAAGARAGLDELGISDHYVLVEGHQALKWSMPLDALPRYLEEIESARKLSGAVTLRAGVEADYLPGTVDELGDLLGSLPLDYVLGSVHLVDGFLVDCAKKCWDEITQDERNDLIREYWRRIAEMARSGRFDIVGHLDLCKKFGYHATVDLSEETATALDAIAQSRMAVEINTSGWYMPDAREVYPSPAILRGCYRRGIPVLVSADAHTPANLLRGYDRALALAKATGYTRLAAFEGRKMRLVEMA